MEDGLVLPPRTCFVGSRTRRIQILHDRPIDLEAWAQHLVHSDWFAQNQSDPVVARFFRQTTMNETQH